MPTVLPLRKSTRPEPESASLYIAVIFAAAFLVCGMVFCAPAPSDVVLDTFVIGETS